MDRYTRKDADEAFRRLCKATGHEEGPNWQRVGDRNVAEVGTWYLDYVACYGGFVINQVSNEAGGVSQPFGPQRHTARQFCEMVRFAIDAIYHLDTGTMDRSPAGFLR